MNNPPYVAIDSCFAITMSKFLDPNIEDFGLRFQLDNGTFNHNEYAKLSYNERPKLLQDSYIGHTSKGKVDKKVFYNLLTLQFFKRLLQNNEIQFVVTSIVLNELNPAKNKAIFPFLQNYCKLATIDKIGNQIEFAGKTDDLAETYTRFGAMKSTFSAKSKTYVPENDAYIMAEATLLGLNLITTNERDFIKIGKNSYNNNRANTIAQINSNYRHRFKAMNGNFSVVTRPYSPDLFVQMYKERELHFAKSPIDDGISPYKSEQIEL